MNAIKHAAKLMFVYWIARLWGILFTFLLFAAIVDAILEAF